MSDNGEPVTYHSGREENVNNDLKTSTDDVNASRRFTSRVSGFKQCQPDSRSN